MNEHDAERRWGKAGRKLREENDTREREEAVNKKEPGRGNGGSRESTSRIEKTVSPFLCLLLSPSLSIQSSFALMNF